MKSHGCTHTQTPLVTFPGIWHCEHPGFASAKPVTPISETVTKWTGIVSLPGFGAMLVLSDIGNRFVGDRQVQNATPGNRDCLKPIRKLALGSLPGIGAVLLHPLFC